MASVHAKDLEKVKTFLDGKESVRQGTISSSLKMSDGLVSEVLSLLEDKGMVKKAKTSYKGHQVNTIVVLKDAIIPDTVIGAGSTLAGRATGRIFFESPCFFCPHLDTCGDNNQLSYLNCPRLDEWISKRLN